MSVTNAISSVIIVGAIIAGLSEIQIVYLILQVFFGFSDSISRNKYFWWVSANSEMLNV